MAAVEETGRNREDALFHLLRPQTCALSLKRGLDSQTQGWKDHDLHHWDAHAETLKIPETSVSDSFQKISLMLTSGGTGRPDIFDGDDML